MNNNISYLGNANNPSNDIKVNDSMVSRRHLKISYISDDKLLIEDLGSTNGTYVNSKNRAIRTKEIGKGDIVLVGNSQFSGEELLKLIKKKILEDKIDFSDEFQLVKREFENRKKELKKLNNNFHTRTNIARVLIVVLIFLFYFLILKDYMPETLKEMALVILIIGSGISALLVEKLFSKEEVAERRNIIMENYESRIACPKCNHYLGNKSLRYWIRMGGCPVCEAKWKN